MLEQAIDLRAEGDVLHELLQELDQDTWYKATQFQGWTVHDVILHLHFFDQMALDAATNKDAFDATLLEILTAMGQGIKLMPFTRDKAGDISHDELLQRWYKTLQQLCDALSTLEPKARLDWFGPSMGVRMFTTARLMEMWAHSQAIYDLLGRDRTNTDRVKHIAFIGVKTFSWTYINRSMTPPEQMPYLSLEAPSGEIWHWGEESEAANNSISGKAEEFAQVVAQTRHVDDTSLEVKGETAQQWMSIAQCFAGPPVDPPAPGTRFKQ